jgi:hypothetical protein
MLDRETDRRWVPHYAEAILFKGASPSAVAKIVTDLLLNKGEEYEHDVSDK